MPHRHDDEYRHRHAHDAEPHLHRLLEVIEHTHGAHGAEPHSHTHIVMTAQAEPATGKGGHRHRLQQPFEHEHATDVHAHRHRLSDLEHHDPDRHWHEIDIIELVVEPSPTERA